MLSIARFCSQETDKTRSRRLDRWELVQRWLRDKAEQLRASNKEAVFLRLLTKMDANVSGIYAFFPLCWTLKVLACVRALGKVLPTIIGESRSSRLCWDGIRRDEEHPCKYSRSFVQSFVRSLDCKANLT